MNKMTNFIVKTEWSGYCRGQAAYLVEAESEEQARDIFYEGEELYKDIIRDDTESEILSVEIAEEPIASEDE